MISINIASLPERKEQLIKTIDSIINQVDIVNVCLNGYDHNPYIHDKVNVVFSDNRYGDGGKFLFLEDFDGYYLTLDDDLIVGETYVKDMIASIDAYKIVSHHGKTHIKFPIESYYRTPSLRYRCLGENKITEPVMFCGTGCLGFHTKTIRPPLEIFNPINMADIHFSIYADSLNIPIWVLSHPHNYFKYQDVPNTIWEQKNNDDKVETDIVNKYFT